MTHPIKTFDPKDPIEKLDYLFDWAGDSNNNGLTDWLAEGETIVAQTTTVSEGLELVSSEIVNSGTAVLVWITGGSDNNSYEIRCQITTSSTPERIAIRTAILPVKKR